MREPQHMSSWHGFALLSLSHRLVTPLLVTTAMRFAMLGILPASSLVIQAGISDDRRGSARQTAERTTSRAFLGLRRLPHTRMLCIHADTAKMLSISVWLAFVLLDVVGLAQQNYLVSGGVDIYVQTNPFVCRRKLIGDLLGRLVVEHHQHDQGQE